MEMYYPNFYLKELLIVSTTERLVSPFRDFPSYRNLPWTRVVHIQ